MSVRPFRTLVAALVAWLSAPAAPAVDLSSAAEFRVTAESQEGTQQHMKFRGFVDMVAGELHIQADEADYFDTRKEDGTGERRVEARGNVVFMRGEERVAGESLQMNLDTGRGVLTKARGFVQPGVFFEAETLERLTATKYQVKGARFTSCYQPTPRWAFSAAKATFNIDDHVFARWVNFKIRGVPTPLMVPVFYYPIQEDQRSTGFLFPEFGRTTGLDGQQRWYYGFGFFWAMGRSVDQTLRYDNAFGRRVTHEFRYLRREPSGGTFTSEFTWPEGNTGRAYSLNWNATQMLPLGLRSNLFVRQVSSTTYQQQSQENLLDITSRQQTTSLNLQRRFGRNTLQMIADRNDWTFEHPTQGERFERRERMPSVRLSRPNQRIGRTGLLWSYDLRGEYLGFGDQVGTDRFTRFDGSPELSRPIAATFIGLTPRVKVRATRYSARERGDLLETEDIRESGFFEIPFTRRYLEGSLEMRGPNFSRVFTNPIGVYSDRIKHIIGPEFRFVYRRVENGLPQNEFAPGTDPEDRLPDTTEIRYSLIQRFLGKRPGPAGKLNAHEFLTWTLAQTYYGLPEASDFDQYYYSALFGFESDPQSFSPIQSIVRFMPTTNVNAQFTTEYNVKYKQIQRMNLTGGFRFDRLALNGGWTRDLQLSENPRNRQPNIDTLQAAGGLTLIPGKLRVETSGTYDFKQDRFLERTSVLRYDIQCCGFSIQQQKIDYRFYKRDSFSFQIHLANIGSVGTFPPADQLGGGGRSSFRR